MHDLKSLIAAVCFFLDDISDRYPLLFKDTEAKA